MLHMPWSVTATAPAAHRFSSIARPSPLPAHCTRSSHSFSPCPVHPAAPFFRPATAALSARQQTPGLPRSLVFRHVASATGAATASIDQPITLEQRMSVRDTVELTAEEQELFSTLLAAVQHAGSGTVLRCAGGWVRDKLLGKESADIDIALDNMLGKEFADLVNQYLLSQGKETRTPAVIHANPDQSKHLETARMKIGGMWIDLVNLRSETYASDSRIPTMEFGTAKQDAMRRDFTINSMFYNINESSVEDCTGQGLQDLRDGLIRTPLPPKETFLDDPLRVLRAVRFATRFDFQLHSDILEAAASEVVRTALGQKVSKERIGTELEGMFNGRSPVAAVELLHTLSLLPVILALHPAAAKVVGGDYGSPCVTCMKSATDLLAARGVQLDAEERRFFLLAALLLPLRLVQVPTGPKGKPQPVSQYTVREAIKWRAKDAEMTQLLHEVGPGLLDVYTQLVAAGGGAAGAAVPDAVKLALGGAIRKLKQHWRLGVLLAPITATRAAAPLGVDLAAHSPGSSPEHLPPLPEPWSYEAECQRSNEVAGVLLAAVEAFGLQDCWQWKPLLDGKQVMAALGLQKPGPELGKAMAAAVDWQLVHPQGTADECKQYLTEQWAGKS